MTPSSYFHGDFLLVHIASFHLTRGDAVIVSDPREPEHYFIKRVIGLPGDTVKFLDGSLYIGEQSLNEPYLGGLPHYLGLEEFTWDISEDEYFVMGDNRPHSTDSREFGPVATDKILGRVFLRLWRPKRLRRAI